MKLVEWIKEKTKRKETEEPESVIIKEIDPTYEVLDEYPIREPYSRVKIVSSPELSEGKHYYIQEEKLSETEFDTYRKIVNILSKEFTSPGGEKIDPTEYVYVQAEIIAEKYHKSLGKFTLEEWDKIFYHVVRDLTGYGPLQTIMEDPSIEDISCNGLDMPIYIWHRKHESIPTNILFTSNQKLNDFLIKLAHKSGKHISSAQPLLDAMLPEKHRLAATFMNEVSMKGSTFCIRKFRAQPLSVVDLINIGTLSERIAAYFWLILEHKKSFMIVGGTGAGKTSMLNALLSLMSQNDKIVTVEEVPELSPPVTNWTQLNSRESFNFGDGPSGNISLFDLIKVSLRYRPDYVIVGEVRGEEAYVLFQALATGHGGLCTMHADSIDRVVKRLTSPPMNVSEVYIPLMNIALYIQRVELPNKKDGLNFGRRVRNVSEIVEFNNYNEVSRWNPINDTFVTSFRDSYILQQICQSSGRNMDQLMEELDKREKYLKEIIDSGIDDQKEVAQKILSYYNIQREEKEDNKEKELEKEEKTTEEHKKPTYRKIKKQKFRLKEEDRSDSPEITDMDVNDQNIPLPVIRRGEIDS
jgi:flagellar protein FlaI